MQHSIRIIAVGALLAGLVIGCGKKNESEPGKLGETSVAAASGSPVERGKYLVETLGGCNDCHTPWKVGEKGPGPDMTKMLSGSPEGLKMPPAFLTPPWGWAGSLSMTAFAGPWGISYAANLTPDPETGLGKWNEADFIKAMRTGVGSHNRPIMPPMPWQALGKASDDDLKAIFAYLHSIPAVKNRVPDVETVGVTRTLGGPIPAPPPMAPPK